MYMQLVYLYVLVHTTIMYTQGTHVQKQQSVKHLFKARVLWVVMHDPRVVLSRVVSHQQRPASFVAVVAIAAMQDVAVEEDGVACKTLHVTVTSLHTRNARIR